MKSRIKKNHLLLEHLPKNALLSFDFIVQGFITRVFVASPPMLILEEAPNPPVHDPDAAGVFPMVVPAGVNTFLDSVVDVDLLGKQLINVQLEVLRNIVWRPRKHELRQIRNFIDYVADKTSLDVSYVVGVGLSLMDKLKTFAEEGTTIQKQLQRCRLDHGPAQVDEKAP